MTQIFKFLYYSLKSLLKSVKHNVRYQEVKRIFIIKLREKVRQLIPKFYKFRQTNLERLSIIVVKNILCVCILRMLIPTSFTAFKETFL